MQMSCCSTPSFSRTGRGGVFTAHISYLSQKTSVWFLIMSIVLKSHVLNIDCKKNGRDITHWFLNRMIEAQSGRSRPPPSWQHHRKWAKMREELVAETTPSGDGSCNPPVTQVATPLIMQNFKA